ncbi:MAG: invasion associated locus B family protein [Gammaproteobacteria bacterium]
MFAKRLFPAVLLASLLGGVTGTSHAAVENGQQFQDWKAVCQEVTPEGEAPVNVCRIAQQAFRPDGKPVAALSVGYRAGQDKPLAVITVPLGVALKTGLALAIDEAQPTQVPYSICVPAGCQAIGPLDDSMVTAMKQGNTLSILFIAPDGKKLRADLSLAGFTAAMNALK